MKKYVIEQSGRSMIEMLGVLAIVGVLSVAGIAGYSKAMAKYKVNKLIDQVSTVAANVRTTFAGQGNYKGLTPETAYQLGIYPEDVSKSCDVDGFDAEEGSDKNCLRNAFGGIMGVGGDWDEKDVSFFDVAVNGLSKEACVALATADWGSSSSFVGILAGKDNGGSLYGDRIGDATAVIYTVSDIKSNPATVYSDVCGNIVGEGSTEGYIISIRFR